MSASKDVILERLIRELPELPRSLKKVAMYVIDHPADFGMNPIRTTSRRAGVSTNTLVRLASHLGYETFQQLRDPFRQALTNQAASAETSRWLEELQSRGGAGRGQAHLAASALGNVNQVLRETSSDEIVAAARLLLTAPRVHLLGMRAPYSLVHFFYYVGRMALSNLEIAPRHANSPLDEMLTAEAGNVLFAISMTPFSRETIEACTLARERGLKLILLSDSTAESLPLQPDISLIVPITSPHYFPSFVAAQALLEWLLTELVEQGGEEIQRRIGHYQTLRGQNQAYWQA